MTGCIVAIGGSAGALEGLERFFRALPATVNATYVVIQHFDPQQKSHLPELLAKWCALPVVIAKSGLRPESGRVYLRDPGDVLQVRDGVFQIQHEDSSHRERHPIDLLLSSVAREFGSQSVGILLSGADADGTLGLRAIQQAGGRTLAQDPRDAKFPIMPESAIRAGAVDRVLPSEQLAAELSRFVECASSPVSPDEHRRELDTVCELLLQKTGHDFLSYKRSTVARRVERRLQANLLSDLPSYIRFLQKDPLEARALLRDLLISVTQFFRDPEAFEVIRDQVVPDLFTQAAQAGTLRAWVPACATGEEAYSIAILLREYQRSRPGAPPVQIFATDIDHSALETARLGIYPESVAGQIPAGYLSRYFTRDDKGYRVSQEIRDLCIFSEHSLLKHPPFSRLDLISCRNLFIYWETELQEKVLPVFHYALNPSGYLFLGPAESIPSSNEVFRTIDKKHRLYQRAGGLSRNHHFLPLTSLGSRAPLAHALHRPLVQSERDVAKVISSALLGNFAPPAFVVSALGEIAFYSGRTGRYLEPSTGAPSNNLFDLVARSLRPELHALLHRSIKTRSEQAHTGATIERDGETETILLTVRPLDELADEAELYLVVIQPDSPARPRVAASSHPSDGSAQVIRQLEEELRETREHLQSTIEEVKSSNEELLSMNEELQSANEELQTSKEELQSTNEELETVNSELAKKVEELDASNSDLQNFFHGTQVPILYLDRNFRVQRFTPAASRIFRLIDSDAGRELLDVASEIDAREVIADSRRVLESLQPLDREVPTREGDRTFLMRITPYRTLSNVIDGVIVTFSDITEIKRAQTVKSLLASIVESSSDAIVSRDTAGRINSWNSGAAELFGYTAQEAMGRPISLIIPRDKVEEYRRVEEQVLQGESFTDIETERMHRDGRRLQVSKTASPIRDDQGRIVGVSVIYRDISERKRAEIELAKLAAIVRSSSDAIVSKDLNGIVKSWNDAATRMFGHRAEEMIGQSIRKLIPKDRLHEEDMILGSISRGERIEHYETIRLHRDGTPLQISVSVSPIYDGQGRVVGAAKIARNITEQKRTEASLREAVRARDEFLSIASHELKTPLTSLLMQAQLRKRILSGALDADPGRLRKMAEVDERQILRLTRLVDDMLDVSRLNSGKLSLKPEATSLAEVVEEVVDRFQTQLDQSGCKLDLELMDRAEGRWDRFRIEQVIVNLLTNAVKYGAGSPIRVRVESKGGQALLSVQDGGIGIAREDQERIFNQFERAVSKDDITGLGLGLYIVKQIVHAHDGVIHVESEPGKGSTFTVRLPLTSPGDIAGPRA